MTLFDFPPAPRSEAAEALRAEVRAFLAEELAGVPPIVRARSWNGYDAAFSRKLGERGWLAMTWPKQYGGHERSSAERYVVIEELLAAGAPVAAHWIADRQSGPLLLRFGTEEQKRAYLPRMAAGEAYTCIGMSEPDVGSDLASVRTRAVPTETGFRINGTKLWTTNAHHAHYMLLFCRTSGTPADRHQGTSQLLIDLKTPGITIRPISDLAGESDFNEVSFEDVDVPHSALVGNMGDGWTQVMSELAFERSGPERFLSAMALLIELVRYASAHPDPAAMAVVGRATGQLMVLRRMSRSVASMLERHEDPSLQATIIKDLGALFEQQIPDIVRQAVDLDSDSGDAEALRRLLDFTTTCAPAFSLRGGTREILRGIIARGLGLR